MKSIGNYNDGLQDGAAPNAKALTKADRVIFSLAYIEGYLAARKRG